MRSALPTQRSASWIAPQMSFSQASRDGCEKRAVMPMPPMSSHTPISEAKTEVNRLLVPL